MRKSIVFLAFFLAGVFVMLGATSFSETWVTKHQVRRLVSSYPGIQVQSAGKALYLTGTVDQFRDVGDLQNIAEGLELTGKGYTVTLILSMSDKGKKNLENNFNRWVGSPTIFGHFLGERFYIIGTADSEFDADRAVEVAKTYLSYGLDFSSRPAVMNTTNASEEKKWQPSRTAASAGVVLDLLHIAPPKRK